MFSNAFEHDISLPVGDNPIGGGIIVKISGGYLVPAGSGDADWVGVTMYHSGYQTDPDDQTAIANIPGGTHDVVSVRARSAGILVEILAGGDLTMGARVTVGANGKVVAGTSNVIGIARKAAANGTYASILLI